MAKIVTLKNDKNEVIYPQTTIEAVDNLKEGFQAPTDRVIQDFGNITANRTMTITQDGFLTGKAVVLADGGQAYFYIDGHHAGGIPYHQGSTNSQVSFSVPVAKGSSVQFTMSGGSSQFQQVQLIRASTAVKTTQSNSTIVDLIYPVGSIYLTMSFMNPAALFGGTWTKIQDTFLLASGTKHPLGETGGEETHKLTVSEMPSHTHPAYMVSTESGGDQKDGLRATGRWYGNSVGAPNIANTGGGKAHNNMPPYFAVNVWQRTA